MERASDISPHVAITRSLRMRAFTSWHLWYVVRIKKSIQLIDQHHHYHHYHHLYLNTVSRYDFKIQWEPKLNFPHKPSTGGCCCKEKTNCLVLLQMFTPVQ